MSSPEEEIARLKKALKESEEGLVALQEQLFEKRALVEENEKFYQMALHLKSKNKELNESVAFLQNECTKKDERILALKEEKEAVFAELEESKEHANQVKKGIEFLRERVEECKLEKADLEEQLQRSQGDYAPI